MLALITEGVFIVVGCGVLFMYWMGRGVKKVADVTRVTTVVVYSKALIDEAEEAAREWQTRREYKKNKTTVEVDMVITPRAPDEVVQ